MGGGFRTGPHFGVKDKLPKDPEVDADVINALGLQESFKDVKRIGDLKNKFTEMRNRVAHFFLQGDDRPLHLSNGDTYYQYSLAGAILLHHANMAFRSLSIYFNDKLRSKMMRGTILPLPEYRDMFVIKPEEPTRHK